MKKLQLIVIIAMLFLMNVSFIYAESSPAETLFELNLLKGDGNGYNLDGKLKRSEAAAFIVKFIGEENNILKNKSKYQITNFSDLDSKEWYMPYIGYCYKNGIVKGYPDGTFKPGEYVSEKSFLMMLVSAMDYRVDTDFAWNDVYRKAYEIGLYSDISYAVKADDNYDFKRGDVVNLIHTSLKLNMNGSNRTPITRLVEKGVINESYVKSNDLVLIDKIGTEITSFNMRDRNNFELTLNEKIESIENITFYKDDVKVGNPIMTIDGTSLIFNLSESIQNFTSYKLVLGKVKDVEGNLIENLEKSFDGPKSDEHGVSQFNITAIKTLSNNQIQVFFSNPVTELAEEVLMYKFAESNDELKDGSYRNMKVEKAPNSSNSVYIKFLDLKLSTTSNYKLYVRGDLKSEYGLYMGEGEGSEFSFSGSDNISESFFVERAEFLDKSHVSLTFNRAYDESSALSEANYLLRDSVGNIAVQAQKIYINTLNDQEFEIVLRFPTLKEDKIYNLEILKIYDVFDSDIISNYKYELGYALDEDEYPVLENTNVINRGLIALSFDAPLGKLSESAAISINNGASISKKLVDPENKNSLLLYLNKNGFLKDNEEYKITITSGIRDIYDRRLKVRTYSEIDGTDQSVSYPSIDKITKVGDLYYMEFSEYIRTQELISLSNYEFEVRNGSTTKKYLPTEIYKIDNKSIFIKSDTYYEGTDTYINIDKIYNYAGQIESNNITKKLD